MAVANETNLLNQVIAVRAGIKNDVSKKLTMHHHVLMRSELLAGLSRTYKPRDDDDFTFPAETTNVQVTTGQVIKKVAEDLTELFDVTAKLDYTNQHARADIVLLGGEVPVVLLTDVPVTYLMFLEKQLTDIETFVRKLPVLPAAENWTYDPAVGAYRSAPVGTVKTKKVLRNHVKSEATERFAAQVDTYTEDVPIGTWTTVKFSGAMPAATVSTLLDRVTTLVKAVRFAREKANLEGVIPVQPGKVVFDYLFAPVGA
jgi:hypothetical protein